MSEAERIRAAVQTIVERNRARAEGLTLPAQVWRPKPPQETAYRWNVWIMGGLPATDGWGRHVRRV